MENKLNCHGFFFSLNYLSSDRMAQIDGFCTHTKYDVFHLLAKLYKNIRNKRH